MSAPEENVRDDNIVAAPIAVGLENILNHFLPCIKPWVRDECTWSMIRGEMETRSRMDYLLGMGYCLFQNISVRDPCHNTDHYMISGFLHSSGAK